MDEPMSPHLVRMIGGILIDAASSMDTLAQRLAVLEKQNAEMHVALDASRIALDDWLHVYAPEECHADRVKETRERIRNRGGTLAYIAALQLQNRKALKS